MQREIEWLPPDEYRCGACGFMVDTPNHWLGCTVGRVEVLHDEGRSHFQIAKTLGLSLTEVRLALDPKAQEAHKRWAA